MGSTQLDHWFNETPLDINEWMLQGLKIGMKHLNLETGIVSRINNHQYVIQQVASTLGDIFSPGDEFELQNTYCEAVARQHKTITYIQVGAIPEMCIHPVYKAVQLESYIGSPISGAEGDVIGTLNFSSHEVRSKEFEVEEIQLIEQMANKISDVLKQQDS